MPRFEKYSDVDQWAKEHPRKSILEYQTIFHRHVNSYSIQYFNTHIVTWYPDNTVEITIDGWNTTTTRDRIWRYTPLHIFNRAKNSYIYHYGQYLKLDDQFMRYNCNTHEFDPPLEVADQKADEREYQRKLRLNQFKLCTCCKEFSSLRRNMIKIRNKLHCLDCQENGYVIEDENGVDCARCRHKKVPVLFP